MLHCNIELAIWLEVRGCWNVTEEDTLCLRILQIDGERCNLGKKHLLLALDELTESSFLAFVCEIMVIVYLIIRFLI